MATDRMSALRVAWDNCFAQRNEGGSGVYAARLLEEFACRPGLEIDVLNGWRVDSQRRTLSVRAFQATADLFWTHAYLPTVLWKRRFDLLHAPAFIAPIAASCPVVITIHDITYLLYPEHFPRWWVKYMKYVMPPVVKSAAAIICGSEHSKRDIGRAYGVACGKVHVIPYGVDHRRFHPGARLDHDWAQQLGIREGYVLHVGAFSHRKNIPTLLRALAYQRSKGKPFQLVLAGSESPGLSGAEEIYETIRQLNLETNVVLTGRVPDQHIPGLYANASMLVMPSLYEGFGFPVLEGMAAGIPVVASNTSSLPEVAGNAAILFPPQDERALADAIEDIIDNHAIAEQLRRSGLERARQFSWQRAADETIEVYRTVAKQ
jgi:glycosyltransferase involved in cell wall biosynthesis